MESQFMYKQNMTGDTDGIKRKGFFEIVKEHKKEIVIGAAIVVSVVVAVLVVKNRAAFKSTIKSSGIEEILTNSLETRNSTCSLISESVEKSVTSNLAISNINVREHVRNLPEGWHPSTSKVELAAKCGYTLEGHQTLVNAYTKVAA